MWSASVAQTDAKKLETADNKRVFLFNNSTGIFYFPGWGNKDLFDQTAAFIDANRASIDDGSMMVNVYGYCGKGGSDEQRRAMVSKMSNRVKSEFISRGKLKETNFCTTNSIEPYSTERPNTVVLTFGQPSQSKATESAPADIKQETAQSATEAAKPAEVVTEVVETITETATESTPEQGKDAKTLREPRIKSTKEYGAGYRWYVGVEGGMPFGISSLTSFTEGETFTGWQAGAMVGYRFSPLLSLELGANIGKMSMGSRACCDNFWVGIDGTSYPGATADPSILYSSACSSVAVQQYALRLNVDMMQIVNARWDKRLNVIVSPAIYGVNTKATVNDCANDIQFYKRNGQFQFGAGVGLGVNYQITKQLGVGLRSGAVWVIGDSFAGVHQPPHKKENIIWNNTATITWRFGYR